MKKPSPRSSSKNLGGGFLHAEKVLTQETDGQSIWIDRNNAPDDSNILITLSSPMGTQTTYIGHGQIVSADPSHFVRTPVERVKPRSHKHLRRLATASRFLGYGLLGILVLFSVGSATGYVKARVVLTGSMVPAINPGDMVVTVNPNYLLPEKGKVVSYQAREFSGKGIGVFSHRIVGGNANDGWLVKGDNNPSPDIQRPKRNDILGVVLFTIPFIGKFLTRQALFFIIPIVVGVWLAFDGLKESPEDD